jgi:hypothetical protein
VNQFQATNELMKNQKAAQVLSDQSNFQALQTSDGGALFFGVSDTNILYITREQTSTTVGWTPLDMTTGLAGNFQNLTISAKSFSVAQDPASGNISMAQIVQTSDGQDHLFVAIGLPYDTDAAWLESTTPPTWVARPYDDSKNPVSTLTLQFAKLTAQQNTTTTPALIAGVVAADTGYVSNYIVNLATSTTDQVWTPYPTAENFDELLGLEIGRSSSAQYWGVYELYTLSGETSLTFTPSRTVYPGSDPVVSKLPAPAGATAIATVPADTAGHTSLYVAGEGAIYLFPPSQQNQNGTAIQIVSSAFIEAVDTLVACINNDQVVLCMRTAGGTVLCTRCPVAEQSTPGSWSVPVPIALSGDQLAPMLDLQTSVSTLFVHAEGALTKLAQDPVTTLWQERSVLLPPLSSDDVYETYTHTTHVEIVDDNGQIVPQATLNIASLSPVAVYINDVYVRLSATPLQVTSSVAGIITIVQETQALGGIPYQLVQDDSTIVEVNPAANLLAKLGAVQQGSDLGISVSDELGNLTPLLPATVLPGQADLVAQTLVQFVNYANTLPAGGGVAAAARARNGAPDLLSTPSTSFGLSFANGEIQYLTDGGDLSGALTAIGGDILHWLKQTTEEVDHFFVQICGQVADFYIQIGDDLYHFILACTADVVHGIEFVFNKIGTAFGTLVQWLGFIFDWNDILTTHAVIRNIFNCYITYYIQQLDTQQAFFQDLPNTLGAMLDTWSGLPQPAQSIASTTTAYDAVPGKSHPSTHWANNQLNSNGANANASYTYTDPGKSGIESVLHALTNWISQEKTIIVDAASQLQSQVFDQVGTLTVGEMLQRCVAIIVEGLLESICDAMANVTQVLQFAIASLQDVLTAPLDIPVLSKIYSDYAKADLTILDLVCLLSAIPVTAVCKIALDTAPFADAAEAAELQTAADVDALRAIFAASPASAASPRVAMAALQFDPLAPVLPNLQSATDRWNFAANIIVFGSSFFVAYFNFLKTQTPTATTPAILGAIAYIPYCCADFGIGVPQTQMQLTNERLTASSIIKAFLDIGIPSSSGKTEGLGPVWVVMSAVSEAVIDILWMIPAFDPLANDPGPQAIMQVAGNVCFNLTGIIAVVVPDDVDPTTKEAMQIAITATALTYGTTMLLSSFLSTTFWPKPMPPAS